MAYKDSSEIANNSNYALGDYSFRIERSSVPGSSNDKIEAICTDKDGKNARKSIQVSSSTQLNGWYVEANETEATVYVVICDREGEDERTSSLNTSIQQPILACSSVSAVNPSGFIEYTFENAVTCPWLMRNGNVTFFVASTDQEVRYKWSAESYGQQIEGEGSVNLGYSGTVLGKMVRYSPVTLLAFIPSEQRYLEPSPISFSDGSDENTAYTMLYGTPSGDYGDPREILVGRFAINFVDADPGDWDDPDDWDPEWEPGDPTHTLYVTVTGALSGRHNDPIYDPSYSYIPADKDTVKDYGCGGDGGHGGGGGAGASTVVVYKFATNQANSKEVTAIARRHGYGSGGGKGGKGGDGCILVYYGNGDSPGPGPEPVIQPIVASLSVNKASAAIGEDITWTLSATGGNGNYQYSFILLDSNNQQVHSTGWQSGSSFSYSLQTEGTYHVAGYVRDSRETDTAQAPQSGNVQVSGSEPTPTPTPTGNAESQYNIYEIGWTGIATSGEGPEPTPTPEGNVQSQYSISELNWSSTVTGGEEPGPEPTPTPQADVLSNYEISDLSWTVEVADTTPSPSPEPEPAPTPDGIAVAQFDISSLSWNVSFN